MKAFVLATSARTVLLGLGLAATVAFGIRCASLAEDANDAPAKTITVEPQKQFSIKVSTNPSTGYTLGLAYLSEGIFLLRTEIAESDPNAPPGAPVEQIFHFYQWHPTQPEEAPEIVFGRFQQWDLQGTYQEEKYVLQIKKAPKEKKATPARTPPKTKS